MKVNKKRKKKQNKNSIKRNYDPRGCVDKGFLDFMAWVGEQQL